MYMMCLWRYHIWYPLTGSHHLAQFWWIKCLCFWFQDEWLINWCGPSFDCVCILFHLVAKCCNIRYPECGQHLSETGPNSCCQLTGRLDGHSYSWCEEADMLYLDCVSWGSRLATWGAQIFGLNLPSGIVALPSYRQQSPFHITHI